MMHYLPVLSPPSGDVVTILQMLIDPLPPKYHVKIYIPEFLGFNNMDQLSLTYPRLSPETFRRATKIFELSTV